MAPLDTEKMMKDVKEAIARGLRDAADQLHPVDPVDTTVLKSYTEIVSPINFAEGSTVKIDGVTYTKLAKLWRRETEAGLVGHVPDSAVIAELAGRVIKVKVKP